jgi:hypothetical protein
VEHFCEAETTIGSPFYEVFASDRIPKVNRGINVHIYTHSSDSPKLYQRIPVIYTKEFRGLLKQLNI